MIHMGFIFPSWFQFVLAFLHPQVQLYPTCQIFRPTAILRSPADTFFPRILQQLPQLCNSITIASPAFHITHTSIFLWLHSNQYIT